MKGRRYLLILALALTMVRSPTSADPAPYQHPPYDPPTITPHQQLQSLAERHYHTVAQLTPEQMHRNLQLMTERLFPNRTIPLGPGGQGSHEGLGGGPGPARLGDWRNLQTVRGGGVTEPPPGYDKSTIVCVKCTGMLTCNALNGFMIEEVYLPNQPELRGTCIVLDQLGTQVATEIFGPGRTFRDTQDCRDMVMQYLCLFYGSNNAMYRNWCQFTERVGNNNPAEDLIAPRYPCRSFCVQVATTCAYDPLFVQLCSAIACPPVGDDCTADPSIGPAGNQQRLAANLGCKMPFSADPYSPKNGAPSPLSPPGAGGLGWAGLAAVVVGVAALL